MFSLQGKGGCLGAHNSSPPASSQVLVDMTGKAAPDVPTMKDEGISHVEGGWIQVNNTLVPYVQRGSARLLPVSVLRNAADLLRDQTTLPGQQRATPKDSACLNASCKAAGVDFRFVKHTKLITLDGLLASDHVLLRDLPKDRPFEHAEEQRIDSLEADDDHVTNSKGSSSPSSSSSSWLAMSSNLPPIPYPQIPWSGHDHLLRKPIPLIPFALSGQVHAPVVMSPAFSPWKEVGPINIQPLQFRGKAISCLVEAGQYFALLEVFSRVYFPERSLKSLLLVLSGLGVRTRALTVREELAFIAFYNLPTRALNCKKMVSMAVVAKHFADICKIMHRPSQCPDRKPSKGKQLKHTPFRPWVAGKSTSGKQSPSTEGAAPSSESNDGQQGQPKHPVNLKARRLERAIDKIRCGSWPVT